MIQFIKKHQHAAAINGLILTVILLVCWSLSSRLILLATNVPAAILISRISFWVYLGLMYLYAIKIEKQPFLLWPEKKYPVGYYILSVVLTLLTLLFVVYIVTLPLQHWNLIRISNFVLLLNKLSPALKIFGCITAGVAEELIFRGYMMSRLELAFKNKHITVIASSLVFGLAHVGYGTIINIIAPLVIGLVFGYHYYKFRNIKILMICHLLIDLNALFSTLPKHIK